MFVCGCCVLVHKEKEGGGVKDDVNTVHLSLNDILSVMSIAFS